jgi:nucleoid DNA-binding protein
MPIRYRLEENPLQPGSFYARVIPGEKQDLDALIPAIEAKTALSSSDVRGVVDALIDELIARLTEGVTVSIDRLARFNVSLRGRFESDEVTITAENAQLHVVPQDDGALRRAVANGASYVRQVGGIKAPVISSIFDVASGAYDRYTAPGILRIKGADLEFHEAQPDEGVFLDDGTTETRLPIYSIAGPRQIDALLPAGLSGALTVIMRARYNADGDLREERHQRPIHPA